MFSGNKGLNNFTPQQPGSTFSSFNTQQQNTGFGNTFGAKPGGNFGAPAFGQNASVFGAQQPGTSLFGSTATPQQQQQQGFGCMYTINVFFVIALLRKYNFIIFLNLFSFRTTTTTTATNINFR